MCYGQLITALVIKDHRTRDKKECRPHYDSLYHVLVFLSQYTIPLTKHRISTNRNVLISLLSKEMIKPVTNKKLLIKSEYENIPYYVISMKGIEYFKGYEFLQQLLV